VVINWTLSIIKVALGWDNTVPVKEMLEMHIFIMLNFTIENPGYSLSFKEKC
jgi:hypothetical protein